MTTETDKIEDDINRSRHALNDTIEALGGKLTPGQIVDEAMGLLKGQAGKFTTNLGRQVRDNPIPLLLIAAGAALLFTHKGKQPDAGPSAEDRESESRFTALEAARLGAIRGEGEEESAWSHRLHELEAGALGLKQHAGEAVDAFKARVRFAGEGLAKTAASVRDRLASGYSHAAHAVADGAHDAKQAAGDLKHRAQGFYDDNPLAAGAIGMAIGALIGATAPLSSLERDKLQGLADAAGAAGADLAERGARTVEKLADKAVSAVH